jgi:methylmalonyl-CoA mutase
MSNDRASDDLPLAAEFPAAGYQQWRRLAEAAIEGARFEDRLQSLTAGGLVIESLYGRAPNALLAPGRRPGAPWQVLQRIDHPDSAVARTQALEDLEGGANGILLVGAGSIGARGYGLRPELDGLEPVLDAVDLESGIAIECDFGFRITPLAAPLATLLRRRSTAPEGVNIRFGIDPLGSAALLRDLHIGVEAGFKPAPTGESIARLAHELAAAGFRRSLFCADGRIVHDAGGTEAQELAFVLASGIATLRALEAGGIVLDDARRMIFFRLTADTDQFLTIAKFRALRRLWERVEASCGLAPEPIFISAETAWRIMTRYDPTVNIVRATIAAFAAGIGGVDAIAVLPFTAARGLPDPFARRIARNTQLVLLQEANVARVADPTAGTGWSEDLTAKLCHAAWALLQEIETTGGASVALQTGLIQTKVAAARAERERAVATGREALVGINEYPDLSELPITVLEAIPLELPAIPSIAPVERLAPMRLAEPFEALRDPCDRMAAAGKRPMVFLASLGEPADYAPRADFAKNFFAAGGIEMPTVDSTITNVGELVTAFEASGAKLACLCAVDDDYRSNGTEAAKALSAAGALRLYAVGAPAALETHLRSAGVHGFISRESDMLQILREVHHVLEVSMP